MQVGKKKKKAQETFCKNSQFYNIFVYGKYDLLFPQSFLIFFLRPENEEQPSSPSVKKAQEKGVVVVHEVKCKLYVKVMFERQLCKLKN